jgi:hypothetical protein
MPPSLLPPSIFPTFFFPRPTHLPPALAPAPPTPQRYFGVAFGKGARAAKTDIEKTKFAEKSVEESLGLVAKMLLALHDEGKDKQMEIELGVCSDATGGKFAHVSAERREAAVAWAKAAIEAEEMEEDD